MRVTLPCVVVTLLLLSACAPAGPPVARVDAVIDTYHGVQVDDPYRWLEDWDNPEVKQWSNAQNEYARSKLDVLPSVEALRTRVTELLNVRPVQYFGLTWRGGRLFALKDQPPLEQPLLVVMPAADRPQEETVIIDLNHLDPEAHTSIDFYVPSPDGSLVAVSLSAGGSESGDVHLYETATGAEVGEVIPRVNGGTAGGDLEWLPDGSGFFYTRYPREGERPAEEMDGFQQLWFHELGTPTAEDRYELGEGFSRIAEIEVDVDPATGLALAQVQYGDSGRFAFFGRSVAGQWRQLADYDDEIVEAAFGPRGSLFLISQKLAPRGLVLTLSSLGTPLEQARLIIAEGDDAIVTDFYGSRTMAVTDNRLFLIYQLGGPSEIRVFDHNGNRLDGPEIPPVSSIADTLVPLDGDEIMYLKSSFIDPPAWFRFAEDGSTTRAVLSADHPVDFSDVEVVRVTAPSKDGTEVPLNIVRRKGIELDGDIPTMLTGYGGFGVSVTPRFRVTSRLWLDAGGVMASANLRGGGEFGEDWHRQGMLTSKQNVFDDFYACMQYLIDNGYTNPDKLVIQGGSNGGLLMGAMIIQHPETARTVVSHVGVYDMLRVELSPNGRFNIPEFGTVEEPDHFAALHAYSPYHNVLDRVSYPAVLFLTGANDPRVDPMQSRKMTARLQAATSSGLPILLRTSADTGHGGGTPLSAIIEELVDVYAFVFDRLGVEYSGPGGTKTDGIG